MMLIDKNISTPKLFKALGIVLSTIPTLVVVILLIVFSSLKRDYDDYDTDLIINNGTETKGKITRIEVRDNIEINGKNPYVFYYAYWNGQDSLLDAGEIMGTLEVQKIEIGDQLPIKFYNNQSLIMAYDRSSTDISFLYIIPVFFTVIGIVFYQIGKRLSK